jgi:hypothetical protein
MATMTTDARSPFWEHAAPLLASGEAEEGTVMGHPCLRVRGEFLAMPNHVGEGMVVKLPRERVEALIREGVGEPFAPAGRAFREWVLVREHDADAWDALLAEGQAFVSR